MTDHELAVSLVLKGHRVFREVHKDIISNPADPLTITLLPVLLMSCCAAVYNVALMKQLAAAVASNNVEIPKR